MYANVTVGHRAVVEKLAQEALTSSSVETTKTPLSSLCCQEMTMAHCKDAASSNVMNPKTEDSKRDSLTA